MSAESSSLSLVLASGQTMRDVSGIGQSDRSLRDSATRYPGSGAEERQSFRDHMNEVVTAKNSSDNVSGTPAAKPAANPESANKEPSAGKEPSAEKEPLAGKQPSASKDPSNSDVPPSTHTSLLDAHYVAPGTTVAPTRSVELTENSVGAAAAEPGATLATTSTGSVSANYEALLDAEVDFSLVQSQNLDLHPANGTTLKTLLLAERSPGTNSQIWQLANGQQSQLPLTATPSTISNAPLDLRMQVRAAVLELVKHGGSTLPQTLPQSGEKLPLSSQTFGSHATLNGMLSTKGKSAGDFITLGGTGGSGKMGTNTEAADNPVEAPRPIALLGLGSNALQSGVTVAEGLSKTGGEQQFPQWHDDDQEGATQTRQFRNSTDSNAAVLRESSVVQVATTTSSTLSSLDTGSSASVQELVDGLLNADADAAEPRAERSPIANSGAGKGMQSGQVQPGTGVQAPGTSVSQSINTPAAMGISPGGALEQSMMQVQVGQQIMLMHERGISSARIRLDPPELGSLIIKLEVQDRSAVVHFSAQHQMVRDSLEQQLPRLQEMMDDMGLELGDASVDSQAGGREETEQHDEYGTTDQGADVMDSDGHPTDQAEESGATASVLSLVDQYV